MPSILMLLVPLAGSPALPPGEIFGDVRLGETYVANATVRLICAGDTAEVKTDQSGSYRIRSKLGGKCSLSVTHKGQSPSVDVVIFDRPTRYRLILEEKAGKLTLKRV